jgi:deoxyribodipyrimidine photolyase-related protein
MEDNNNNITLIFPTQLFNNIKYIETKDIYLIEEPIFFTKYNFHKIKLSYHRATMKYYYDYLKKKLKNHNIKYIDFHKVNDKFYKDLIEKNINIYILNPTDHPLTDKLKKIYKNRLIILPTQNFLLNDNDIEYLKNNIFSKSYNHNAFYIYQRTKLDILMKNNKPEGGKWSFDDENRKKLPNNSSFILPKIPKIINNKYTKEAINYVNNHFDNNYGDNKDNFIYPINYKDSIKWLDNFLHNKLNNFGTYEDAISENDVFIFHSILSPMMNIGLLTDTIVINRTMDYYNKVKSKSESKIKIQNIEGFIRQICGWRNYIYCIYMIEKPVLHISNSDTDNKSYHKLWTGNTNMYPIDSIITNKILTYGYCHHIERLMVLGNYMKLCMIPNDLIYRMFMEWHIDSFEWVMWGNIYGMVLSEIKIMKKNYIASSNYIFKMSNFKNIDNWSEIFNCLYYNYISKNIDILQNDYGLRFQISLWKKKPLEDKKNIISIAENYLKLLNKKKK